MIHPATREDVEIFDRESQKAIADLTTANS
jgi:hypothetical protein